jgi:hypothetical protein
VYVIDCIVASSLCIVMEEMCMCLEFRKEVLNEGCALELWLLGLLDETRLMTMVYYLCLTLCATHHKCQLLGCKT